MFELVVEEVARVAPSYVVTEEGGIPIIRDPGHPQGAVAVLVSNLESAQTTDLPTLIKNRVHNALMTLRNGNRQYAS